MCVEACKWVGIKIVIQRNKYTVHLNEAKTVWEFEWWCYINIRVYMAHIAQLQMTLNHREKKTVIALDLTSCI